MHGNAPPNRPFPTGKACLITSPNVAGLLDHITLLSTNRPANEKETMRNRIESFMIAITAEDKVTMRARDDSRHQKQGALPSYMFQEEEFAG